MFVIPVLAILAALGFRRAMREKGYYSSRLWVYPVLIGSAVYVAQFVLGILAGIVLRDKGSLAARAYPEVVWLLSVVIMFTLIARAWQQIKALPPREKRLPPPTNF